MQIYYYTQRGNIARNIRKKYLSDGVSQLEATTHRKIRNS